MNNIEITATEFEIWLYLNTLDQGHYDEDVDEWPETEDDSGAIFSPIKEGPVLLEDAESAWIDTDGHTPERIISQSHREVMHGGEWHTLEEYPKYLIRVYQGKVEIRKAGSYVRNRIFMDEAMRAYCYLWTVDGRKEKVYLDLFKDRKDYASIPSEEEGELDDL